jgi:hypothetical protein
VIVVDEATFRILDTLSRELGSTISIHQLTSKIREYHGTAYYAGTYNKLNDLRKQGLITLTSAGRSSIPSLNLASYSLLDMLSEIELRKKREFLEKSKTLQLLLMDMESYAHANASIESISIINPERNARLNRAEFLILLHHANSGTFSHELISLDKALRRLQSARLIRIDSLSLTPNEFRSLLIADEINPLKEMLSNRITFYNPSSFWLNIAWLMRAAGKIKFEKEETTPGKISDIDLNYNLLRFGYRELGTGIKEGRRICIEYVASALLMQGGARQIDAVPIILAKNNTDYNLLVFLCQKYGQSGKLLGLLRVLQKLKPNSDIANSIKRLEAMGAKEIRADGKSIGDKMKVYDVNR